MTDHTDRLTDARLYLCTDARRSRATSNEFLDAALAGGVDIVQLRQKEMEAADELAALEVFADACKRHGKLLAVNDRADIAFAAGADVLHLGQRDLPVHAARAIIGPAPIIGRSTHSFSQVNAAVAEPGSDYFCVGPTWETPTKPGRQAAGLELVAYAAAAARRSRGSRSVASTSTGWTRSSSRVPRRVVVVRAITAADDPGAAAAEFTRRLREAG